LKSNVAHWDNNSYIDETPSENASGPPESGLFRDITIEADRELWFFEIAGKLYYYGTLSIDENASIYYHPEFTSPFEVTTSTTPAIDDLIIQAVGTIYGDWDGDCEITAAELNTLHDAISEGEEGYNPLYDYDCDGELDTEIEGAAALANYTEQPSCGESLMGGGGGGSMMMSGGEEWFETLSGLQELEDLAAWISSTLSSSQLAEFLADLEDKAVELSGAARGYEMAVLLSHLDESE